MKIYLDVVFVLNFSFDFLLLLAVNLLLKRHVKIRRLLFGAGVGALSIFFLFLPLSTVTLFLLKVITSILMIIVSFSYRDFQYFKKNFIYLYLCSIVLGGFMYFLNMQLSYKNEGLVFFHNGLGINFILLLILGPVFLYYYIKEQKSYKSNYTLRHTVDIYIKKKKYTYCGFIDTGNKLVDPYKKRKVLLIHDSTIDFGIEHSILVPYSTLGGKGIIKCQKVDKIIIDQEHEIKDVLVGKSDKEFSIEGVNCILPGSYKEEFK